MKKIGIMMAVFVLSGQFVYADIIEVKNKGMFNGKIVSDDGKTLTFLSDDGKNMQFATSDIVLQERDGSSNDSSGKQSWVDQLKLKGRMFVKWIIKAPGQFKENTNRITDKYLGKIKQPLDRSAADKKAAQAAKVLDDANKAVIKAHKSAKKVNEEIKRQTGYQYSSLNSAGKKSKSSGGYTEL